MNRQKTLAIIGLIIVFGIMFGSLFIPQWRSFATNFGSVAIVLAFVPGILACMVYMLVMKRTLRREDGNKQ